ncbi:hypothetical protein ACQP2E_22710 [Actinoplanes sp. CA-015351]|uniref:hypothetical protein n=1 Tax=Actinoplanes sp. CA-015351 TaxID=3239897 RepID=UPI003D99FCEB
MSGENWERVALARTREDAIRQFEAWKDRAGLTPADEDIRLNRGRHADGKDYWEIIYFRPQ